MSKNSPIPIYSGTWLYSTCRLMSNVKFRSPDPFLYTGPWVECNYIRFESSQKQRHYLWVGKLFVEILGEPNDTTSTPEKRCHYKLSSSRSSVLHQGTVNRRIQDNKHIIQLDLCLPLNRHTQTMFCHISATDISFFHTFLVPPFTTVATSAAGNSGPLDPLTGQADEICPLSKL